MITLSRFGNKCVYLKTEFLNLTNLSSTRVLKLKPWHKINHTVNFYISHCLLIVTIVHYMSSPEHQLITVISWVATPDYWLSNNNIYNIYSENLGMHILGMLRWLVRCMSRPVQNHLDSYKMYNQILQCLLILLINFILYLTINLKNILKIFTPAPPPHKKCCKIIFKWFVPGRPCTPFTPLYAQVCQNMICLKSPAQERVT